MSIESICRRPQALPRFIKSRRAEQISLAHQVYWEDRLSPRKTAGEQISRRLPKAQPHPDIEARADTVVIEERVVYSRGANKPTIGEKLLFSGVTREAVNPHFYLDDPNSSQTARLSEALKHEKQGSLTKRGAAYLSHVRAYLAVDHLLAFRRNN